MSDDIQARIAQIELFRSLIGDSAADAQLAALPRSVPSPTAPVDELVRFLQALFAQLRGSGASFTISGSNISIGNVVGGNHSQDNIQRLSESIDRTLAMIAERERQPSAADLLALEGLYREQIVETQRWLTFQNLVEGVDISLPLSEVYIALQASSERSTALVVTPKTRFSDTHFASSASRQREHLENELELMRRSRWNNAPPRVELSAALRESQMMVVLGEPGSGKSTLLRYLALAFAENAARIRLNLKESRLPILVPLAAYEAARHQGDDLALSDFLPLYYAKHGEIPGLKPLFDQVLDKGRAIVLLDGLDEVTSEQSRRVIAQRVEAFVRRNTALGNRIVLTSRTVGYRSVRLPGDLPHYTLHAFGPAEIERFTSRWCRAYEVAQHGESSRALREADAEQRRLLAAINDNASVTRLAANPLLLTILALIHRQGKSLPRRRIELYDLYARTLLESWNRARSLSGLQAGISFDMESEVQILAPLALWMHTIKPAGTASRPELLRELRRILFENNYANPAGEAERWLRDVAEHSSLLVERGGDAWSFLHLTFQEYFAARAIVTLPSADRFLRFSYFLHDVRWREVILLTAGYIGVIQGNNTEVTQFVEKICHATGYPNNRLIQIHPPSLVGNLLLKVYPEYQLWRRVEVLTHRELFLAASILNDDVSVKTGLTETIGQALAEAWWKRKYLRETINALIKLGGNLKWQKYVLTRLEAALTDQDPLVRRAAVDIFAGAGWWRVINSALRDSDVSVQIAAINAFGSGQQWDSICFALNDVNSDVRCAAIATFGAGQQWDSIRFALKDDNPEVRRAAVVAFGAGQQWDAIRFALKDHTTVRHAAIVAFGVGQRWDAIRVFLADSHISTRALAVAMFGAGQQWDSIRFALADRTKNILRNSVVMAAAVEAFGAGQQWQAIRFALSSYDEEVRRAAVATFGAGHQWDSIRFALNDDSDEVRRAAVVAFGAGQDWKTIEFALTDKAASMREVAVAAFGAGHQWDSIVSALKDKDASVRRAAVKAFMNHPKPELDLIARIALILQRDTSNEEEAYATLLALVSRYEANLAAAEIAAEEEG